MIDQANIELHALSALMKSPQDVYAAHSAGLTPQHFTDAGNRMIFHAVSAAAAKSQDTSVQAVWLAMGQAGDTLGTLVSIDDLQSTSAHRADLVRELIDAGRRRTLGQALAAAMEAYKQGAHTFAETWERVAPHLQLAQDASAGTRARTLADMARSLIRQIEEPDLRVTVKTPWASWDAAASPLRAGELVTIAGRPGTGKTALAVQLADQAQSAGTVAVFSLEMSGEELVDRVAKQRMGHAQTSDKAAYLRAIRGVGDSKRMHVFDTGERHAISTIESRSRLLASLPGGLAMVAIDYLQLVDPSDRRAPREQQVAEMSRRLKQLAGALKCPVLLLAQLNRESEKEDRRPRLSDLRESGAIEQDSDRVWFLWRDMSQVPAGQESPCVEVQLIQAKCRGGPPNIMKRFVFNRPAFRFDPVAFQ